jgi:ribonucleoside-diphosphate reductase alpha chain
MAVMSVYHPDILDFINCKLIEGDIHNFNISVGVDSAWMEQVSNNLDYNLIDPVNNSIVGKLNSREVFNKIIDGAWKNGEPGMIFIDQVNTDNHVQDIYGDMIATNPCGEQPLLPNESCNLGSINLAKFFRDKWTGEWEDKIDWDRLEKVTRTAVHFLDNVIDANKYATSEIERMTKATRKIGLGVMGFSDLLIQLRVPYNSKLSREIGEGIISKIRFWSDDESLRLAIHRGSFPDFEKSNYNRKTEYYRNHCRLTVAPTGTISMISDCSSGIEPTFALAWKKQNILEGKTLNYVNKYFEKDATEYGFYSEELMDYLSNGGSLQDRTDIPNWIKRIYITAPEISPENHVLMQAAFQKYVDSGISKTINFPNNALHKDVEEAYLLAWKTKCKGITVYRAGSRDKEVLVKGHYENDVVSNKDPVQLEFNLPTLMEKLCCDNPYIVKESGCEVCKNCGWSACKIS